MKVGILINNAAQFINGSEQQPQFVIEMLEYLGIEFTVYTHRGKEDLCGFERSSVFNKTQLQLIDDADLEDITTFIMICHIVEDSTTLSKDLQTRLANKKVVQFHCGNHCLFNAEDVVFNKHNVVRLLYNTWFSEAWVFEMHYFAKDYYEALTQKQCKKMPYSWSPSLISAYMLKEKMDIYCRNKDYSGKLTLCCFEPNLNVTKTCLCPLLIMNAFYLKHPDRVQKCFIFCSKQLLEHRSFRDFVGFLKIFADNMVEFYPRMPFPNIMQQIREKNMAPVVIGHQLHNDQNYLSLEALHLGYPLLHNSPSIQNAGAFYEQFEVHAATSQLENLALNFCDDQFFTSYTRRAQKCLSDISTSNACLLKEFANLLA